MLLGNYVPGVNLLIENLENPGIALERVEIMQYVVFFVRTCANNGKIIQHFVASGLELLYLKLSNFPGEAQNN
jgi:hypothetical protein